MIRKSWPSGLDPMGGKTGFPKSMPSGLTQGIMLKQPERMPIQAQLIPLSLLFDRVFGRHASQFVGVLSPRDCGFVCKIRLSRR